MMEKGPGGMYLIKMDHNGPPGTLLNTGFISERGRKWTKEWSEVTFIKEWMSPRREKNFGTNRSKKKFVPEIPFKWALSIEVELVLHWRASTPFPRPEAKWARHSFFNVKIYVYARVTESSSEDKNDDSNCNFHDESDMGEKVYPSFLSLASHNWRNI